MSDVPISVYDYTVNVSLIHRFRPDYVWLYSYVSLIHRFRPDYVCFYTVNVF